MPGTPYRAVPAERKSLRRRLAGWAGIEDRPPLGQESWWFPDDRRSSHHSRGSDSDVALSLSRCNSDSTHSGDDHHHHHREPQRTQPTISRKRDWFKVLLAARNLATVVYAVSYTTSLPVLPFMANRLIFPRESTGPGDAGSEGVDEAWRGMAYGLVMSGYYLTKMISAPCIGYLSDRVGRRQALVVTLLGGALSFFVTKIWGQYSIHGLILCRLLMGCFAANGALMHAYIRDTVPPEWQSSAFSQHSASWGCAYLAAPAMIAWAGDSADAILVLSTVTMIFSAIVVEFTFVDTRPKGFRSHRMRDLVGEYLKEGARDLAEVGKKMSGVDLAEYFNGGREREMPPSVALSPLTSTSTGTLTRMSSSFSRESGSSGIRESSFRSLGGDLGGDLSGGAGAPVGGAGNYGLRHRNLANGRGGRLLSQVGRDGEGMPNGCASSLPNGDLDHVMMMSNGSEGSAESPSSLDAAAAGVGTDVPAVIGEGDGGEGDGSGGEGEGAGAARRRPKLFSSMSTGALVGVFKGMMTERLIMVTFVLQAIRPAQDLAPLVSLKFSGGASVLAGITSSRSLCRVLVPMTPLIPWLVRLAGGSSSEGATARMSGDRAVAAFMCVLMAGLVAAVPAVGSLQDLHHLMFFKGLCYIVRESTAGAVMARAAGTASVGAFFGWQHCIKGVQGTISHFLTGWLSGYSIATPYYVVAICDLLYAFTYLYI